MGSSISGVSPGSNQDDRETHASDQFSGFVMTKRNGHGCGDASMATWEVAATVVTILCITSAAMAQDLAADTGALVAFRTAFDPRGTKLNWSNTTSPCSWTGVVCTRDRVTQIRLPGEALTGVIPSSSLSLLSELRVVSLRNNKLTGPFPGELGNCSHVRALFLGGNNFYGPLPDLTGFWPRLTHLSLEYNRFNGSISASIGLFARLYLLNLRNNSFTGSIPPFSMVNLTLFDVGNNNLSGAIPATLTKFGQSPFLGNAGLCGPPLASVCTSPSPSPSPSPGYGPSPGPSYGPSPSPIAAGPAVTGAAPGTSRKLLSAAAITAIIGGGVALLVLFTIGLFLCCWKRLKRWRDSRTQRASLGRGKSAREKGKAVVEEHAEEYSSSVPGEPERNKLVFVEGKRYSFDLEDLLRASAEVLGKGSVGTTYKAVLEDGTVLAVKRLKDVTTSRKEFDAQVDVVGKLQHRNLVPLRAYYFSKDEKLLVYEYMHMGSLSALLHGNRGSSRTPLDWVSRVRIAIGVARGLAYVHAQGGSKLVHGNIKSSNVLLHRDLEACLSDFGLAQLLSSTAAASRVVGYRAPEINETRKATHKSDVYSFGVLLLELLTGKAPNQVSLKDEGMDLPQWVQSVVREEWTAEVFDLELMRYQNIEEEMVAMLQLAMQCVHVAPDRRPSMSDVVPRLEDVHPFSSDTGDENSRQSSEEKSKSSEVDKESQDTTPSHHHNNNNTLPTPSAPSSDSRHPSEHAAT